MYDCDEPTFDQGSVHFHLLGFTYRNTPADCILIQGLITIAQGILECYQTNTDFVIGVSPTKTRRRWQKDMGNDMALDD